VRDRFHAEVKRRNPPEYHPFGVSNSRRVLLEAARQIGNPNVPLRSTRMRARFNSIAIAETISCSLLLTLEKYRQCRSQRSTSGLFLAKL
jgi:hypothetical protein